jgi:hypothetical protein
MAIAWVGGSTFAMRKHIMVLRPCCLAGAHVRQGAWEAEGVSRSSCNPAAPLDRIALVLCSTSTPQYFNSHPHPVPP